MSNHDIDSVSFICDIILSAVGAVSHESGVALPWGFFFVLVLGRGMTSELRRRRGETVTVARGSGVAVSVLVLALERRRDDDAVGAGVTDWSLERRRFEADIAGGVVLLALDEALRDGIETEVLTESVLERSGLGLFVFGELCRARFGTEPRSVSSTDCKVPEMVGAWACWSDSSAPG